MPEHAQQQALVSLCKQYTFFGLILPNLIIWGLRVPEECPVAVLNLYLQCLSSEPEKRPTAADIMEWLSTYSAPLRPNLPVLFTRPPFVSYKSPEEVRTKRISREHGMNLHGLALLAFYT